MGNMVRRRSRSEQALGNLDHRIILGSPPLIDGEDPGAYDAFYASTAAAIKPKDFIEKIWVRDVVDLSREVVRMRRLKAKLLRTRMTRGIEKILRNIFDQDPAERLARQCAAGDQRAVKKVEGHLAAMGLDPEAVTGEAMCSDIGDIEIIDRQTMIAETRRNTALREIERRRAGLGVALQRASDNVIEGEFRKIPVPRRDERDVS